MGRTLTWSWRRAERPLIVGAAALALMMALVPPLASVAYQLARATDTFRLLASGQLWSLLLRSLLLSAAVTITCVVAGVPLGVLFARATFPFRKLLIAAHLSIAFLPPFLPALGWFQLFGRQGLWGSDVTALSLFSELGVIGVLTSCFTPIVSVLTALGVAGVDVALEDAGRVSLGPFRTAALVLVPCAAPAISLAALVVFALTFSELGVPMFLGAKVYPAVVFARLGGMDFAPGEAAVLMLPLVLVALALAGLERRFAGGRALAAMGGIQRTRRPLFSFRASSLIASTFAASLSVAPIAALSIGADFRSALGWLGSAPHNSLMTSATAAAAMTLIAALMGRELAGRSRVGACSDGIASFVFLMPSSILGIGLITAWNREATGWLYGTLAMLVLGFVARYSAIAIRAYAAVLSQIPASLDEAARVAGLSYPARVLMMLRMTPRGITATFLLALVFALRDLETAVLYYPAGAQPLTVRIFTLEANGPPGVVSALAVFHVALTLAALAAGALLFTRIKR